MFKLIIQNKFQIKWGKKNLKQQLDGIFEYLFVFLLIKLHTYYWKLYILPSPILYALPCSLVSAWGPWRDWGRGTFRNFQEVMLLLVGKWHLQLNAGGLPCQCAFVKYVQSHPVCRLFVIQIRAESCASEYLRVPWAHAWGDSGRKQCKLALKHGLQVRCQNTCSLAFVFFPQKAIVCVKRW